MNFCYTNQPVVNMRKNPDNESEVVSQTFLSENVSIQNHHNDWLYIQSSDHYFGWVPKKTICFRNSPYQANRFTSRIVSHLYKTPNIQYGPLYTVAYQTPLQQIQQEGSWILIKLPDDQTCWIQQGNIEQKPSLKTKEELPLFAQHFLEIPYTWGGRTSFGYDCSGFVQMLYKQININLPRDSSDQIQSKHLKSIPIENLTPGDLIFFGAHEKSISHVGLYLKDHEFIHATIQENRPWLRISKLSDTAWDGNALAIYPFRIGYQPI